MMDFDIIISAMHNDFGCPTRYMRIDCDYVNKKECPYQAGAKYNRARGCAHYNVNGCCCESKDVKKEVVKKLIAFLAMKTRRQK